MLRFTGENLKTRWPSKRINLQSTISFFCLAKWVVYAINLVVLRSKAIFKKLYYWGKQYMSTCNKSEGRRAAVLLTYLFQSCILVEYCVLDAIFLLCFQSNVQGVNRNLCTMCRKCFDTLRRFERCFIRT